MSAGEKERQKKKTGKRKKIEKRSEVAAMNLRRLDTLYAKTVLSGL